MIKRAGYATWMAGLSSVAIAQAPPQTAETPAPAPAAVEDDGLGEIVVTAQRRTQTAREVPLAVSALSGSDLVTLNILDVTSLVATVPGISGAYQGVLQPFVVIRGISSNSIGIGGEASVGIFVDEAYIGRISAQSVPFLDTERVEVLRGPQGSLYGRNSTAGAISIITNKPELDTYSLDASASYGRFGAYEATAAGTAPLGPNAAVRLALLARGDDGYDRNVTTGSSAQTLRTFGGRLSVLAELSDAVRANLSASFSRERAGTLPFKTTVPELAAAGGVDTDPFSGRFAQSFDGNERRRAIGTNLTLAWDIDDDTALRSVTSYNNVVYSGLYDIDGSALPLQKFRFTDGLVESFGQEFRLSLERGAFSVQLGGNIFLERVRDEKSLTYDENFVLPFATGSIFGAPDGTVPADTLFVGSPAFIPCDATSIGLLGVACSPAQFEAIRQRGNYRSMAAFVEVEAQLSPELTLTGGGRYSIDYKRFGYNTPPIVSQGSILFGTNPILQATTDGFVTQSNTWRDFQPRAVLRWQPMQELNIYASATRGFKSGGFDPAPVGGVYDPERTEFDPESVWSYEVGLKASLLDRRAELNLAAYRFNYRGFQVQVLRDGITSTLNVPQYDSFGIEADLTVRPSRQLTLTFGGAWNNAEYGDFVVDDRFNPGAQQNLAGNRNILSPEWSGFARLDWTMPLNDVLQARVSADANWRSEQFFTIFADPRERQAGYALVGGRITVEHGERWSIALLAQNIFDQDYLTSAVEQGFGISTFRGRPRTWAVELRAAF